MKGRKLNQAARRKKLVVRDTGKYGKGVYAAADFKKGEPVYMLDGERLDLNKIVDRVVSGNENLDDIFQIGKRTYLDLDEISRTFNHSCNPTCGFRGRSELFALRDIKKGEQLTYDYSATIAPTDWSMKCKCGSANCRKVIHDVLSIPKSQLNMYKREHALPRYLKELLVEIGKGTYRMPVYEKRALERLAHI